MVRPQRAAQATAVAAGGVTITAVVTKGGETVNTAAALTITEDMAEQATLFIASIKDSDENDDRPERQGGTSRSMSSLATRCSRSCPCSWTGWTGWWPQPCFR